MKVIVGLGNPGREYAGTRHSVGFEVIDRLAARVGWIARAEEFDRLARSRFDGLAMDGAAGSGQEQRLLLLKPMTYMNRSGGAVRAAIDFYRLEPAQVLVVLDDLALPVGRIRLRSGGSSGGHNGLRDIEQALGTNGYPRLRIGIDPPPQFVPGKDYVLGRFTEAQRQAIEPALDHAADAAMVWIEQGIEPAMNRFNATNNE
jgi:peptidyl-tRNA hydrolase, PTH1 family